MAYTALPPWSGWAGPRDAKLVFVAEAWGRTEAQLRRPLVGESGAEFFRMLWQAAPQIAPDLALECDRMMRYGDAWVKTRDQWLDAVGIGLTNVLAFQPPGNKISAICGSKAEVGGATYLWPKITTDSPSYLRPEYLPEVDRLFEELSAYPRNLVVALGNTACWALLRTTAIGSIRGAMAQAGQWTSIGGTKTLPTYHPAGVLRQWSWRTIVVADLMKAFRESASPELHRPQRRVLINPTIDEMQRWTCETLAAQPALLACDSETMAGQMKCISFARSRDDALVIPFVDFSKPNGSYWPDEASERLAWDAVDALLSAPMPKLFQNGLYDLQYITRVGIAPRNCTADTMLLHHSLFPELQKGLGFLGSIYTDEPAWKLMRRAKTKEEGEKRDE